MTNNDLDSGMPEEFEKDSLGKPSLREIWESNPMMKLAAIALGGAVLVGGYFAVSPKDQDGVKSVVHVGDVSQVKQIPGQTALDPAYKLALEAANKKAADIAAQSGGSALPTPIGTAKGALELPEMPEKPKSDPLAEWRKAAEASRMNQPAPEEQAPPPPEAVPMLQPIRPQMVVREDPNAIQRLSEQMRTIIAAQAPAESKVVSITKVTSPYAEQEKEQTEAKEKSKASGMNGVEAAAGDKAADKSGVEKNPTLTITSAGTVAYAQLINELNSDIQGPVLAQILSGPFAGGRAIGKIDVKDEYMVITFTTVVKDAVSYKINAVALDEKTTLAGQATDVDHHYFTRVVLPAAAAFVQNYGSAVSQTGTTTTQTSGGGQAASTPAPSPKQSIAKGFEGASQTVGAMLNKGADRPITVKIAKGTTMGILFIDTVTTKDVTK